MKCNVNFHLTPTKIKGKERPRFRRIGNFVTTYTPKGTKTFEDEIREAYKNLPINDKINEPINEPIEICIDIQVGLPKSWSKKKKDLYKGKTHCVKPDLDNITKAILDALNGIAYQDDSLIYKLTLEKHWSFDENNHISIAIN